MLTSAVSKTAIAVLLTMTTAVWYPGGGGFKCYMDYRTITDTSSAQYSLQAEAYTDEYGLRKVDECYCIALGSAYGSDIGSIYEVTLSTGVKFMAILADQKADCDTAGGHTRDRNGAVIEFIVEADRLPASVRATGSVGSIDFFKGNVEKIRRLKK